MKRILYSSFLLLLCAASACKKLIDAGEPRTQTVASIVFSDSKTATAVLMGIYASLEGYRTVNTTTMPGLSADELISYSSPISRYYTNSLNASINNDFWSVYYGHIYQANNLIDQLQQSPAVKEADKRQLIGEALFLRVFCHFYLTNYFGNIPYITTPDYKVNSVITRVSAKDSVYPAMIRDLKLAQSYLSVAYPTAERVRVNKAVATALLARLYLYHEEWKNAEDAATAVISNTSDYGIESIDNAFLRASKEAIWQFSPNSSFLTYSAEALNYILRGVPAGSTGRVSISSFLYNAFETDDLRKTKWIGTITPAGSAVSYQYAWKYKTNTSTGTPEYSIVMRLAEQYLIRAEARARQQQVETAADDVDVLRQRAGLGQLPENLTQPECLDRIMQERRVELFVEWGHRWLDLKRTGLVNTVMPAVCQAKGGSWKPEWALYPIPQVQLNNNPAMADDQNEGYK
ncbi:SusD family protein [Filimonas lacunae]|uniref:SusD family protein n=1 Tax=Filimonas lacunae TaxID=477680 RepID=A0A173MBZ4_9BACT|nr:RagB/SusD family nutrient uptake outer membrane protein [Filimonas lacunae]BAV05046.1 outer membrane protein, nutrient binding [Filimonas lacunae]SIT33592.1 SusD family protein [Filimonas lacunae]